MKLRLCSISFKKNVKVQIDDNIKTMKSGKNINVIELGHMEAFNKDHFCGVFSEQINNVKVVKIHIDKLMKMPVLKRIEWFNDYFPHANIIKINNSKLFDQVRSKKSAETTPEAVITASVDLVWGK